MNLYQCPDELNYILQVRTSSIKNKPESRSELRHCKSLVDSDKNGSGPYEVLHYSQDWISY